MNDDIQAAAYSHALAHLNCARRATSLALETEFPNATLDERLRATDRAFALVDSSRSLAEKVWMKALSHDSAEAALLAQFPEFPEETVRSAFSAAVVNAR